MNAPTTEPVTPSITPAVTPSFEGGGEINGLTAEEAFYLWVKRGLKQPAREKYLRPLGLFNTDKSKAVEEKLKKIYALNGAGAITEQGKELARQIDNATTGKLSRLHTAMDFIGKFNELKDSFGKTKFEHGGEVSVLRTRVKIIKTKLKSDKNNSVLKTRLKLVQKMLEGNSINRQQTESTADNLQPTNEDKEWVKRGEAFWNDARKNAKKLSEMSHNEFNDWMVENHFGFYKDNVTTLRYVSPSAEDDAIERLQNQVKGFVKENVRDSRTQEKIEQPKSLSYGRDDYEQAVYDFADTLSENARSHARQALLSSKPFTVREKNEFQNITEKKQRFVIADFVLSNFLAGATIKPFSNSMAMTNALYPTTSILQGNFGGALPKIAFDFFRFLQTHKPEATNQFIKNPKYNPYDKEETAEYLHMAHVTGDTKAFSENVMALVEKHKPALISAINKLTPFAEIKDVQVYGSIAEGRARNGSDIDLKVIYTKINDGFTDVDLKDDLYGKLGVPEIAGAFDIGVEEYSELVPEELDTTPKVLKYAYEIGDDVVFYAAGNELVKAKIKIPSTISDDGVQVWLTNRGYKREDEMLPAIVSAAQTSSGGGYKMFKGIGGSKYYEVKFADGDKFTSYRSDRASAIDEAIKHRLFDIKDFPKTKFENKMENGGAVENKVTRNNVLEKIYKATHEPFKQIGDRYLPYRSIVKTINEGNYYIGTTAHFREVETQDKEAFWENLKQQPDAIHKNSPLSSSEYILIDGNVYRYSNHWGRLNTCYWSFDGNEDSWGIGVCPLSEFTISEDISFSYQYPNKEFYAKAEPVYQQVLSNLKELLLHSTPTAAGEIEKKIASYTKAYNSVIAEKQRLDINGWEYGAGGSIAAPLLAPNGQPSKLSPIQYALVRTPEFKAWFGDWEKLALLPQIDSGIDEVTLSSLSKDVSKVLDENGEPLVCWHSSNKKFTKFRTGKELGAHFGTKLQANDVGFREGKSGHLYQVFLNIKNPIRLVDNGEFRASVLSDKLADEDLISEIQSEDIHALEMNGEWEAANKEIHGVAIAIGIDGVVYINRREGINHYDHLDIERDEEAWEMFTDTEKDRLFKIDHPEAKDSWIVFSPNQIKLADGTNQTFEGSNADIRYAIGGVVKAAKTFAPTKVSELSEKDKKALVKLIEYVYYNNIDDSEEEDWLRESDFPEWMQEGSRQYLKEKGVDKIWRGHSDKGISDEGFSWTYSKVNAKEWGANVIERKLPEHIVVPEFIEQWIKQNNIDLLGIVDGDSLVNLSDVVENEFEKEVIVLIEGMAVGGAIDGMALPIMTIPTTVTA